MDTPAPPPVLASARVIAYAVVDAQMEYTGRGLLLVNGQPLGRVPRLAICENLAEPHQIVLFHCDESWNVLGVAGADTVEAAKVEGARNYPEIDWVYLELTREEALASYDSAGLGRCSFCDKREYEMEGWIEGTNARICRGCVEEFYRTFRGEE